MYETLMALQGRPLNFLHQQVSISKAVQETFENLSSVPRLVGQTSRRITSLSVECYE